MRNFTTCFVSILFWLFLILSLTGIGLAINDNYQTVQKRKQRVGEFEKQYPVGTLVQHRLSTAIGVIVGHDDPMLKVRFPSEYAGVQAAVDCLPLELVKTGKNILDDKVEKE